uniref:NPK1-activating kinesin-like protein C-terminal domain-containing protein n=2 Tax=Brassica TaxID=3705 RepID=A0A0D3BZ83_BRAOL
MKWDVSLEGKQRKLHFVNKLWTDPYDSRHVQESAEIVAKLVGFCESGNISKRCLSSTSPCLQIKSGTITRFLVKFETITIRLPCMILAPVPRPLDSGYNKPQF